jgi:hypothetical protein
MNLLYLIFLILTGLVTCFLTNLLISSILGLLEHRRRAKATGLPYFLVPFFEINMLYAIIARTSVYSLIVDKLLPSFITRSWLPYSRPDWRFIHKDWLHKKHGDLICVASPSYINITIADPAIIHQVMSRPGDFKKMDVVKSKFSFFLSLRQNKNSDIVA